MNLMEGAFSLGWLVPSWLIFFAGLAWSLATAPWYKIKDKESQHVFLATTVVVFLFWNHTASIGDGLTFHFLLSAVTTLMFGPQFALLSAFIALGGVSLMGNAGWLLFGLNATLMAIIPILIVWGITVFSYRYLERNFFVFVLLNGFLSAGVSSIAALSVSAWVMYASEVQTLEKLQQSFIPFIPLMGIPEGFVNGTLILALVLMKPQWVSCFTDEQFLKGK